MRIKRVVFVLVIMILIAGSVSASATSSLESEISDTWTLDTINGDAPDVANISTIFVGEREIPYMIYVQEGVNNIFQVWEATEASPGNCGTDNKWVCHDIDTAEPFIYISNLATETYPDTFVLAYAYPYNSKIWGSSLEYYHNMVFVDDHSESLIELGKFGSNVSLAGPPSIAHIGGHFRMAVTLKESSGDFYKYKLVYLYYKGGSNTSCRLTGTSGYDCIVIEETGWGSINAMGSPALIYKDGKTKVLYNKENAIRYAYPWTDLLLKPSNCGVEGNTWRCIDLEAPEAPTTVGLKVDLAVGKGINDLAAAYTVKATPTSEYDSLMRAKYVGSGGNCGGDVTVFGDPIYTWDCGDVDNWIDDINVTTFHIAYDDRNFPVISYNNILVDDEYARQRLYVAYDKGRVGLPGAGTWDQFLVDGNNQSTTGYQSDIAFSSNGRAFIGYWQPHFQSGFFIDLTPNLKVATQWFTHTYLPGIMK